jgi:predicted GNAT family N-acyltransferase
LTDIGKRGIEEIKRNYPLAEITLATSQHTHLFYARMGFEVLDIFPSGLAPNLDKYEMKWKGN